MINEEFSGGLSAANPLLQGSGVKVPAIHITREGITAKWSDLVAGPVAQLQREFEEKFNPNWASDAPRGGRAVLTRILKESATVPLFFAHGLNDHDDAFA